MPDSNEPVQNYIGPTKALHQQAELHITYLKGFVDAASPLKNPNDLRPPQSVVVDLLRLVEELAKRAEGKQG